MVPGAGLEPARPEGQGILSPMRLPISPPGPGEAGAGWAGGRTRLQNKEAGRRRWRRGSESNRRLRSCSPLHNHSATAPETKNPGDPEAGNLERETRFELATPTLARLCSTTELFPLGLSAVLIGKHWSSGEDSTAGYPAVKPTLHLCWLTAQTLPTSFPASALVPLGPQLRPCRAQITHHRPQRQRHGDI